MIAVIVQEPGIGTAGPGASSTAAGTAATGAPVPIHGGRVRDAELAFPAAPRPMLDLSTGINPFPFPSSRIPNGSLHRLPDPADETRLRAAAARRYGVPGADHVAAGPGSQLLINLLPLLLVRRRALILGPTYAEHARAWLRAGTRVAEVATVDALRSEAAPDTVLVLCNPNNPDGARYDGRAMAALAATAARTGAVLIVDEAFADLEPDVVSAAAYVPDHPVVVLRSFGKTYGLAGLRLGFLLADPTIADRVRCLLGPWAVGGPAIALGLAALGDPDWLRRSASRLGRAVARLDALLARHGMEVAGGTSLFRLVRCPDAATRWERLCAGGVLSRQFADRPDRLRFGIPGREPDWDRLQRALAVT